MGKLMGMAFNKSDIQAKKHKAASLAPDLMDTGRSSAATGTGRQTPS